MEKVTEFLQFLKSFGIDIVLFIAGGFGGLVVSLNDKNLTRYEKGVSVVTGSLAAMYLTPFFASVISVGGKIDLSLKIQCFFAFIIGNMGIKGVAMVIEKVKSKFKNNERN